MYKIVVARITDAGAEIDIMQALREVKPEEDVITSKN